MLMAKAAAATTTIIARTTTITMLSLTHFFVQVRGAHSSGRVSWPDEFCALARLWLTHESMQWKFYNLRVEKFMNASRGDIKCGRLAGRGWAGLGRSRRWGCAFWRIVPFEEAQQRWQWQAINVAENCCEKSPSNRNTQQCQDQLLSKCLCGTERAGGKGKEIMVLVLQRQI